MERKVLRMGALVIIGALVLRLFGAGAWEPLLQLSLTPKAASWIIFFQTGRLVRADGPAFVPSAETVPETDPPAELTQPTEAAQPTQPVLPAFSPDDAAAVTVSASFSYAADLASLISKPLTWDLTGDAPTVLIVHSHATESFSGGDYDETSPYHTLDAQENMLSIGGYVAQLLEAGGINVLHDTTLHDAPSYDASYTNSRKSVQDYLQQYPTIRLVLDLHRDSYEDAQGNQLVHTVFSEGVTLAPLMFVVGTDYGGLTHPKWQENLSLALKLQTQLETLCPGICRSINLRSQRFNQDLSTGALLVEVGASGNTRQEALNAAKLLAEAILSLAHGSQ